MRIDVDSRFVHKIDECLHSLERFMAQYARAQALEEELISHEIAAERHAAAEFAEWFGINLYEVIFKIATELETVFRDDVDASPCHLRSVPIDMIAQAVWNDLGGQFSAITTDNVMRSLVALWQRHDPPSSGRSAFDTIGLFEPSSFLAHEGASRLRD